MESKTRLASSRLELTAILRFLRRIACAAFCIWSHWSAAFWIASSIVWWSSHSCELRVDYPSLIVGYATPSWGRLGRSQSRQARTRMTDARLWLVGITARPPVGVGAAGFGIGDGRLRRLAGARAAGTPLVAGAIAGA